MDSSEMSCVYGKENRLARRRVPERGAERSRVERLERAPDICVEQRPRHGLAVPFVQRHGLEHDLGGSGRVGRWLWEQFVSLPLPDFVRLGGVWPLGDSPPVLLTALDDASSSYAEEGLRRVYTDVDMRLLVGDLLAKLRLHEAGCGLD